ncbi:MAG: hypothetical protein RI928_2672 [Pseudomonadota bacterium]
MIWGRHFVKYFGIRLKRLKAVSEALWDVDLASIMLRKFNRMPFLVGFGVRPYIDNHVKYCSACSPHQLVLCVRRSLPVHSSECPDLGIKGNTLLRKLKTQTKSLKLVPAYSTSEKSSEVVMSLDFNYVSATFQRNFIKNHIDLSIYLLTDKLAE